MFTLWHANLTMLGECSQHLLRGRVSRERGGWKCWLLSQGLNFEPQISNHLTCCSVIFFLLCFRLNYLMYLEGHCSIWLPNTYHRVIVKVFSSHLKITKLIWSLCSVIWGLQISKYIQSRLICLLEKYIVKCNPQKFQRHLSNDTLTPLGGGHPIDVGLLGENHHKINLIAGEGLLLSEDVFLFLTLPRWVDRSL